MSLNELASWFNRERANKLLLIAGAEALTFHQPNNESNEPYNESSNDPYNESNYKLKNLPLQSSLKCVVLPIIPTIIERLQERLRETAIAADSDCGRQASGFSDRSVDRSADRFVSDSSSDSFC